MSEHISVSPEEVVIAERLKGQWSELVSEAGRNTGLVEDEFAKLAEMYRSGDGRSYHNLFHIANVDEMLNRYRKLARNFTALKFAGDGHDVVYVPGSGTNEADSGAYMRGVMQRLGMPEETIAETERLILVTKDHKTTKNDIDGKLMIDADFAIFASPTEEYDAYAQGIWEKYVGSGRTPEALFNEGRSNLLRGWLDPQNRIFLIDEIREDLESLARQNLQRELARLQSN